MFNNLWTLLIVVLTLLLGAAEFGFRLGLRLHATHDEPRRSQINGVQGAILGLLGLLLGFTFAMAVNRHDARRSAVIREANAIGTAWLRTSLLPENYREPIKDLLSRYVTTRVKYEPLLGDPVQFREGRRLSAELQAELWKRAEAVAREHPSPISALFVGALNEVIDIDTERRAAARNRIPAGVWGLLIMVAAGGCFTTGYGSGAQGARSMFTNVFLPALVTVVILIIFDFTHSHQGVIGVSQQPMLELQESIHPSR